MAPKTPARSRSAAAVDEAGPAPTPAKSARAKGKKTAKLADEAADAEPAALVEPDIVRSDRRLALVGTYLPTDLVQPPRCALVCSNATWSSWSARLPRRCARSSACRGASTAASLACTTSPTPNHPLHPRPVFLSLSTNTTTSSAKAGAAAAGVERLGRLPPTVLRTGFEDTPLYLSITADGGAVMTAAAHDLPGTDVVDNELSEVMKKAVVTPDLEKQHAVPPLNPKKEKSKAKVRAVRPHRPAMCAPLADAPLRPPQFGPGFRTMRAKSGSICLRQR